MPDIARHIPNDTYGVFILDLGIIFPAIMITVSELIRGEPFANILKGVVLIKEITVCLSWGFGEIYIRIIDNTIGGYDMLVIPILLTILSVILFVLYIQNLQYKELIN